ncbi:MAG: hypothetical protein ACXV8Q_09210 [Methylobacter sp.]
MNSITKKTLLIGFMLPCACAAHYPQQYSYYPGNSGYSSGYAIMHGNHHGERPSYYDNGYRQGNDYFPHHDRYDQYKAQPRGGNNYQEHRQRHDSGYGHQHNDDDDDNHHNNVDRRSHH